MFKGLGNLASLMKQASEISGKVGEISQQLKTRRVTGSSGGGMVEVECDGTGQVLKVTIDPMLVENQDMEMIQDLLPAAFNTANQKAKQLHLEMMQEMTGGGLPGMNDAIQQMMGDDDPELEPPGTSSPDPERRDDDDR